MQLSLRTNRLLTILFVVFLAGTLCGILGGAALSMATDSQMILSLGLAIGYSGLLGLVPVMFLLETACCGRCGKPFHRPEYRSVWQRIFSRITPHWSCLHCGDGRRTSS